MRLARLRAFSRFLFILLLMLLIIVLHVLYHKKEESVYERIQKFKELSHHKTNKSKTCGRYPKSEDIYIMSRDWQILKTPETLFLIYGAYLDDRTFLKDGPVVRILMFTSEWNITEKFYCQFWSDSEKNPVSAEVIEFRILWKDYWGTTNHYTPILATCKSPPNFDAIHVSLTRSPCDEANNVQVINRQQREVEKKDFLVCVKDLEYDEDKSMALIEWLEILKIFGAQKIVVYVIKIHDRMMKVLKFYENDGLVEIFEFHHPEVLPTPQENTLQFLMRQLISYHDCFYRNNNNYKYIIPLDIDEFIVPKYDGDRSWYDLIKRTVAKNPRNVFSSAAFVARNAFFFINDKQKNFFFIENTNRAKNFSEPRRYVKSFMRTDRVLTIHNHLPLSCVMENKCSNIEIDKNDAQLSHYRLNCNVEADKELCEEFGGEVVKDNSLWKFKNEIIRGVNETLKKINQFW